jgi:hypothetical protein
MKIIFFFSVILFALVSSTCNKVVNLPHYTPPVSINFSVTGLNHTQDTVNIGDTIYLTATGVMYDTTKNIYVYLTSSSTSGGVSTVINYGSATSPIKLSRIVGAPNAAGLYTWTSTIMLPNVTFVPAKSKLSIVGYFIYQLSLSSEQGVLTATDAGQANKTVFVQ